jgi:5'-nucleotidase
MSDGYDGYDALKGGNFIIDHENGALMSTLVRKYLLGASFLWRMKQLRSKEDSKGSNSNDKAGEKENAQRPLMSRRTNSAIDRALRIGVSNGAPPAANAPATPQKKGGDRLADLKRSVDQSPSGIRNAIHVGDSEHHADYDNVSDGRSVCIGFRETC